MWLGSARGWLTGRGPKTILIAGWLAFLFGCYPGYLTFDSALQFRQVRGGDFTDYAPVMTELWSLLEYLFAGPAPMLVLQSGLFLFGLAAILRTVLSPRAAAVVAVLVLLFPPVFTVMSVIWPDPLLAGALLAGTGALIGKRRVVGGVLLALACACRPEIAPALIPLVLLALPPWTRVRRAAISVGLVVVLALVARFANTALTTSETYRWEERLLTIDVVGTLRRAGIKDPHALLTALDGLPLAHPQAIRDDITAGHDAIDESSLSHGDKRVLEPIASDEESAALSADWRRAVRAHPGAYLIHRWTVMRGMLGIVGPWDPVFDGLCSPELCVPELHFKITLSDWEMDWRAIVQGVAKTPLFRPWLYVLLAIAAVIATRKHLVLRRVVWSGVIYELCLFVLAPATEFRFSHWLIVGTVAGLIAMAVARKVSWRADPAVRRDPPPRAGSQPPA